MIFDKSSGRNLKAPMLHNLAKRIENSCINNVYKSIVLSINKARKVPQRLYDMKTRLELLLKNRTIVNNKITTDANKVIYLNI